MISTKEYIKLLPNWRLKYERLKKYYKEHGNSDVSIDYVTDDGISLGAWVAYQRYKMKNNILNETQIELLENVSIKWNFHSESWDYKYSLLKDYYDKHGNIDVKKSYVTSDGIRLGEWLTTQRQKYKKNELGFVEIGLLEKLGIKWTIYNKDNKTSEKKNNSWNDYYNALKNYYLKNHSLNIPGWYQEDGLYIGKWLSRQRLFYRQGKMSDNHIDLLNHLDNEWYKSYRNILKENISSLDNSKKEVKKIKNLKVNRNSNDMWDKYYLILYDYYKRSGNSNIPMWYEKDGLSMDNWIRKQRRDYKNNTISNDRKKKLNDIEFDWTYMDTIQLNNKISDMNKYNKILLNRLKHILNDLSYEMDNSIDSKNKQKIIEDEIIKRIWR